MSCSADREGSVNALSWDICIRSKCIPNADEVDEEKVRNSEEGIASGRMIIRSSILFHCLFQVQQP